MDLNYRWRAFGRGAVRCSQSTCHGQLQDPKESTGRERTHPWDRVCWGVVVDLIHSRLLLVCGVDQYLEARRRLSLYCAEIMGHGDLSSPAAGG